ncbi:galactoside 2-alpha-L-fucosyltransferase Sec1 [Lepeophtheirus salmonis]|uniref:galactoside 2-alpha-L-fucosyltransferase Sec1 n=1 Tax=Lepeophtheirus salmonis TaxID=72036 RepID=UPI001AE8A507|nr:galactoside 2-alpha-L-fucosyltransferase Sec1-like [Lepeophtheirus salmonis]
MNIGHKCLYSFLSIIVELAAIANGEEDCGIGSPSSSSPPLKSKICRTIDFQNFKNEPSILYGESKGRFGNQLLGYALFYQFKVSFGFNSYITQNCRETLDLYFTPEFNQLPVLEEEICNWKDIPWESYTGHFQDFYNDPSYRKGRFILLWPQTDKTPWGYRPEDHHCKEQDIFNKAMSKNFKNSNRLFPKHISDSVDAALNAIADSYPPGNLPLEFISIHNRRTDHHEFMKVNFDIDPLPLSYFKDAMEYFREDLEGEARPVFIYVSDDMDWGRERLGNEKDIHFVGKGTKDGVNVHLEDQVYDLALLIKCNKTIVTRGTYSLWVSILVGGEYYTEYGPIALDDY